MNWVFFSHHFPIGVSSCCLIDDAWVGGWVCHRFNIWLCGYTEGIEHRTHTQKILWMRVCSAIWCKNKTRHWCYCCKWNMRRRPIFLLGISYIYMPSGEFLILAVLSFRSKTTRNGYIYIYRYCCIYTLTHIYRSIAHTEYYYMTCPRDTNILYTKYTAVVVDCWKEFWTKRANAAAATTTTSIWDYYAAVLQ